MEKKFEEEKVEIELKINGESHKFSLLNLKRVSIFI